MRTFHISGFSTGWTLIFASVVPYRESFKERTFGSIVRRMGLSSSVSEALVQRVEPAIQLIALTTRHVRYHNAWPTERTYYLLSSERS